MPSCYELRVCCLKCFDWTFIAVKSLIISNQNFLEKLLWGIFQLFPNFWSFFPPTKGDNIPVFVVMIGLKPLIIPPALNLIEKFKEEKRDTFCHFLSPAEVNRRCIFFYFMQDFASTWICVCYIDMLSATAVFILLGTQTNFAWLLDTFVLGVWQHHLLTLIHYIFPSRSVALVFWHYYQGTHISIWAELWSWV